MRLRLLLGSLVAALALVAGGCGGDGEATGLDAGASIVPADALLFVAVNVDSDSDQWNTAETLVNKFPDGRRVVRQALRFIESDTEADWQNDIKPAIGDELGIAILDVQGDEPVLVAMVKPDDEQKLQRLLEEDDEDTVTREIEGWTVISDNEASLDALETAADEDALADDETFQETMDELGEESLASVYLNGKRAVALLRQFATIAGEADVFEQLSGQGLGTLESAGTALVARDDGVQWTAIAKGTPPRRGSQGIGFEETFDTTLDEEVPAGALAFLSFTGASYQQQLRTLTPQQRAMLRQFEQMLGFSINDVTQLISDEGAFYARPDSPFPEATLLLRTNQEARARTTLTRLARRLAQVAGARVQTTRIGDVNASQVQLGPVALVYAVFDGKAVVTTAPAGIEALAEDGDKLDGDEAYTDALEAAGVPDETGGFFYWNIEDTVPILRNFAQMSGEQVPPNVWANLRPVRSLVFYTAGDAGEARLSAFLRID